MRVLSLSDVHEKSYSLPKYRHICDLANNSGVDAVFINGDFFDGQEANTYAEIYQHNSELMMSRIAPEDRYYMALKSKIDGSGGIEALKFKYNLLKGELKDKVGSFIRKYDRNRSKIDALAAKYQGVFRINEKRIKREYERAGKEIDDDNFTRCRRLDRILGKINCPVYAVRGNHDSDRFVNYKWKNVKFLDKNGVVDIKGVRVAGVPDWYERVNFMPDSEYKGMESDISFGGSAPEYNEVAVRLAAVKTQEQKRKVMEDLLSNNSVLRRLYGKKFDVLMTHKGPHKMAEEGDKNYGWGIGLEWLVNMNQPKVIAGGHIHGKGRVGRCSPAEYSQFARPDYSYQYVRTSDEVMTVLDIDEKTKEIVPNGVQVFKWPKSKAA